MWLTAGPETGHLAVVTETGLEADHDAEDREQPSTPADIPDEPEADVLEQRRGVPYREDDR